MKRVLAAAGLAIAMACEADIADLARGRAVSFPGDTWSTRAPDTAGLDAEVLREIARYLRGDGFVARDGHQVFTWGDPTRRREVASASKPVYSTFLLLALDAGRLSGLDASVAHFRPCLREINAERGHPDAAMTFRQLANQTAAYGVREAPGTAYSYNDWQVALFFDTVFLDLWGSSYHEIDAELLGPLLMDRIGAEDAPTLMQDRGLHEPGRLGISPRDFARFGLLFMKQGAWRGERVLSPELARLAVRSRVSNAIPRTRGEPAQMCPGQRSLARNRLLDQTDHLGSYSFMWWSNGIDREDRQLFPSAPRDVFAALGSRNGGRGMAVMPSLGIVIAWNDTRLLALPDWQETGSVHPLDEVFGLLRRAAGD